MKIQNEQDRSRKILNRDNLYKSKHINLQILCKELAQQTPLDVPLFKDLIDQFSHIIDNQPNLLMIQDPALVIGDIHGQFYDLLKILSHANILRSQKKLKTKLVFLGDYVDRGINAVQVIILLICLKIEYPLNIYMLRGNHQSRIMTSQYNFKSECCTKYSQEIYDRIMEAFDLLPLASVINHSYFCVHGGVSDKMIDIKKINSIHRKKQIPVTQSAYCDFIWSDPVESQNGKLLAKTMFNNSRDCSIVFGQELVREFLQFNQLSTIIRGHQIFFEGYKIYNWSQKKQISSVITIFSAPNYCGNCKNKAAVLKIENNAFKIKQFLQQQPQKYKFLAKFDVFSWTFPQIIQNTKEILLQMMESISSAYIPQLQNTPTDKKINYFIDYAISKNLLKPTSQRNKKTKKNVLNSLVITQLSFQQKSLILCLILKTSNTQMIYFFIICSNNHNDNKCDLEIDCKINNQELK